jgi:hypothetical protein
VAADRELGEGQAVAVWRFSMRASGQIVLGTSVFSISMAES